jgi:hypothetical protein
MKTHHTPGPWLLAWNGRVKRAIFAKGHSSPLAELRASPAIPSYVADKNATLILAAPDMLEFLIDQLAMLDDEARRARSWAGFPASSPEYIQLRNRCDKLRAIIAKAGGV